MIKRLGPKRWQPLHRLVYVVAIGAGLHYYEQQKTPARLAKVFAVVIAVLLAYRVEQKIRTLLAAEEK